MVSPFVYFGLFIAVLVTVSFVGWLKVYFWPYGGKFLT